MTEESRQTAYHEAGHMVVAWELGLNVLGATIVPDPEAGYAGMLAG
jgi:ATP-dependent Zn protease